MKDCIFCKIINKEIPAHRVFENNHTMSFLDIHPVSKGHTVVIPKVHAETLLDFNDELLRNLLFGVKASMERVEEMLNPDGYNVGWNHGDVGGQAVPHLHVHIIPRWKNDGGGNIHAIVNNPGDVSVEDLGKRFEERYF